MGEFYEYHYERAAVGGRDGKSAVRADALARRMDLEVARSRVRRAAFARRMSLEETRSLCRRAERDQREQLLQESRALRAAAEQWLDAKGTPIGQYLAAAKRNGW